MDGCMISNNYFYLITIISLHRVLKFDPFYSIQIIFQLIYLAHRWDPNRYYHSGIRVDLGVMAMKGYCIFPKAPELDSLLDSI